ncbi:vWA domain-containing protein [Roseofilum capinflatum]|uniref:VWA-like domain-containing protein n=1 Tax=Roseofilum capinflatum BLCC-M114 TaxID=3022440 RepID=A0ABT7B6S9_9CYAN|nr:VWA-like domain-containing protein [Roseofilum capinflatum]MDJ1174261.1 VWA-like domain-containing protein [Roseofilum capinflatum BLCC-M114]
MNMPPDIERLVSGCLLRLRMKSPFFATLALFTNISVTKTVPTAATNGKDIFLNADFFRGLSVPEMDGVFLHEVLHAALRHVIRRGTREPLVWNIAADIVVNGMVLQQAGIAGIALPPGHIRDMSLEDLSVEEVYELLCKQAKSYGLGDRDLLDPDGSGTLSQDQKTTLETYWQAAMHKAMTIAKTQNAGKLPAGFSREWDSLKEAQLDWRSHLWRYLVKTPTDFQGFDRRFIGRGLYLETLEGETVHVFVAVDTSGSIGGEELSLFMSEIKGILGSYPHLKCELYYADADVYGPYTLDKTGPLPKPVGGGGTSFCPFFEKIENRENWHDSRVCVYLTDGYGNFPNPAPDYPVLWVVTPGGLDLSHFPFGEAVRLLSTG